ncbi:MAG: gliding motility-associated C-terminal domain-containing protein [Chitinophagales bacterium]
MTSKLFTVVCLLFCTELSLSAQSFQKVYGLAGEDVSNSILSLSTGYLVSGYSNGTSGGAADLDLLMMKIDMNGTIEWSKTYATPFNDFARSTIQTIDGGFASVGETRGNFFVVKTDVNGNLTWAKSIGGGNAERGFSILQNSSGDYFLLGDTQSFGAGLRDLILIKITSNGDLIWAKTYGNQLDEAGFDFLFTDDNALLIGGIETSLSNGFGILILKVNQDGNTLWSRSIDGSNNDHVDGIVAANNGYILYGHTLSCNANYNNVALKINMDGTTNWSYTYGDGLEDKGISVVSAAGGTYLLSSYFENTIVNDGIDTEVIQINESGIALNNKVYGGEEDDRPYWAPSNGIIPLGNSGFILPFWTESYGQGGKDIHIVQDDFNTDFDCHNKEVNLFETPCPMNNTETSLQINNADVDIISVFTTVNDIEFIETEICCNIIPTISENTTICEGENTTLTASGGQFYVWSPTEGLDNANSVNPIASPSITTIYQVTISDFNECTATASTKIFVSPNPIINIPSPINLCQGETIELGFENQTFDSYLWQDGSTNPTFNASQSGAYAVTVTDSNGCNATASTEIFVSPNPIINIPSPINLCQGETIELGFENQTFDNYLWQNSSTNPTFNASQSGAYAVTVTDSNGCTATASTKIFVSPNPIINIPSPINLCQGETIELGFENQTFDSYLWQDGSTNPTFNANQSGTYAVTITDSNGCKGVEMIEVNDFVAETPILDLGADVLTLCQDSTVTLQIEENFNSYLWSNGSTESFLNITEAGTYKVTVSNSCNSVLASAVDSILVITEDCSIEEQNPDNLTKIVVPTAFSPNEDGVNDFMKVWHTPDIQIIEFTIYNRFGKSVFTTNNSTEYWDGNYKFQKQDIGVYVYYLEAIDSKENAIFKKGNFTLIR